MKTSRNFNALAALLLIGAVTPVLAPGCAGSATRQSTGEYVDDASITAKVKTAFIADKLVKAGQIEIETFKGTVQLSGFVDTPEMKERAEKIAEGVRGVRKVVNNIIVK
ncbi:MAG: BON domain-containing protein [Verrucomicrobia bacterium]|nr:BON domain-containing protein [Verrucomicrobiota bacterium]